MITTTSSIIDFEKAERDFLFLLQCFQEVLHDLGEHILADHLPWQNTGIPLENYPHSERALQALSIFFQLLNMAEENSAAQNRRALEAENGLSYLTGLWGKTLLRFQKIGIPESTISSLLPEVSIDAVLTAHPTEAKRKTVLEQHRQLYLLLVKRENQMWTPQPTPQDEIYEFMSSKMEYEERNRNFVRVIISRALADPAFRHKLTRAFRAPVDDYFMGRLKDFKAKGRIKKGVDIERLFFCVVAFGFSVGVMDRLVLGKTMEECRQQYRMFAKSMTEGICP